jgi:hypothetical protein
MPSLLDKWSNSKIKFLCSFVSALARWNSVQANAGAAGSAQTFHGLAEIRPIAASPNIWLAGMQTGHVSLERECWRPLAQQRGCHLFPELAQFVLELLHVCRAIR